MTTPLPSQQPATRPANTPPCRLLAGRQAKLPPDRIRELRRVPADQLLPHPTNYRRHPPAQHAALRAALDEVGIATALIARELPDGSLQLIDGHLRAVELGCATVPVLILDVSADEADKLLATLDPLATLAESDQQLRAELVAQIDAQQASFAAVLQSLLDAQPPPTPSLALTAVDSHSSTPPVTADTDSTHRRPAPPIDLRESYQLVVDCRDEADQQSLFTRLREEGYPCRVLTLS